MTGYPDSYHTMTRFPNWNELNTRVGFGAVFDHLYIEQYADTLRATAVASHWVRDVPDDAECPRQFTVSLNVPSLGINASTLLKVEDELEILFCPKVDTSQIDPITKEHLKEPQGWEAVVIERDTIHHTGTLLVKVWRRYDGSIPQQQPIIHYPEWAPWNSYVNVYIKLIESTKTVRKRLNALNSMHPDEEFRSAKRKTAVDGETFGEIIHDEVDSEYGAESTTAHDIDPNIPKVPAYIPKKFSFASLRSILLGLNANELSSSNFFGDLSPGQIESLLTGLTDAQKGDLRAILSSVPLNILAMHGCAGAGKTWCMITIIRIMLAQNKKSLVCSSTNAAVNNICNRFAQRDSNEEYVKIRLHPEQFEVAEILRFNPQKPIKGFGSMKKSKRAAKLGWEYSLANTILKVAGVVATTNKKLLLWRRKFELIGEILQTPISERNADDLKLLKSCIKSCAVFVLTEADVIFTTSIASTCKWLRDFLDIVSAIFIDEAGCVTETDTLIPYKGTHTHLVLAGNPLQLGPPCISANMKYGNGRLVNPLNEQHRTSTLERFRDIGLPYWIIPEQCRIEPGGFDMQKKLFYKDKIRYHRSNVLSPEAAAFETWGCTFEDEMQQNKKRRHFV